MKMMKEHQQV
uniref:Uncharacterized protein n=1 Tax=Rhizophora mucronata TaxID=61149 RepID=A0A2P2P1W0_RHIMU